MSTERMPFGFNSLIPETYKTKVEAFAKCLQHKLLSIGRLDNATDSFVNEPRQRLNNDVNQSDESNDFQSHPEYFKQIFENVNQNQQSTEGSICNQTSQKFEKTEDSDEEFHSHSESENSDLSEKKKQKEMANEKTKQKLISMSSEDSTVDSWSSCQENLADFEKIDSENEETNYFASQIKGSPKLRNLNIRCKRKEKPWKRNSRKNHSSSTESIDSEGRGKKQIANHQTEKFDSEIYPQYILLDGLESDEIPHRILRESSSTSNLERHFSGSSDDFEMPRNRSSEKERKPREDSVISAELLTPPPSPELKEISTEEKIEQGEITHPITSEQVENEMNRKSEVILNRLNFAEVTTDFENIEFDEVESMKDFSTDDVSRSIKKIGGVITECMSDNLRTDFEVSQECTPESLIVTSVEVFENKADDSNDIEKEKVQIEEITQNDSSELLENADDDEMLNNESKLRRCSSLKTWKTPPGTPGAKKIVRFADALGLDLADVRTFLDEIPKVPSSAFQDLHIDFSPNTEPLPPTAATPTLIPLFQQPGNKMDFLEKVQQQKICLETAMVTDSGVLMVNGYIRVQNICFHKSVYVRYSLNNWVTFSDLQAKYVPNSCDGFSDKFSFSLYGHTLKIGEKLEFALRLECSGNQYWDNNGGINYVFNCLPQTSANSFFSSLYNNQIDSWFDFY